MIAMLLVAAIAISCAALAAWSQTRGVRVTVTNSGPDSLADVVVHVTGNEYRIGGLAVSESRTVRVVPTSESHVELTFTDHLGRPNRLNAGGYFEPGYRGIIVVELENGASSGTSIR